jgi:hypothetical protein
VSTRREDLALERWAVVELEREADRHWRERRYALAASLREEVEHARERVRQLEGEQ